MSSTVNEKSCVLVVAPHPDDETLGCGGTLLRHKAEGADVHWMVVTAMSSETHSAAQAAVRDEEIADVTKAYGFTSVAELRFPTTRLDIVPKSDLVGRISSAFVDVKPSILYLPFPGDSHSDHAATFSASIAAAKWFRRSGVRSVRCYETLSETEQGLDPRQAPFEPNLFIDISAYLERKIEILSIYRSELGKFPFPRSAEAVMALAAIRGASCGAIAAESFMILREVV